MDQLAAYKVTIAELKALEEKQLKAQVATSTTLRKRASVHGGVMEDIKQRQTAQLKIADKAARKTLQTAMTQISDNSVGDEGRSTIASSIQTLAANPELQYKVNRTLSRAPSISKAAAAAA